MKYRRLTLDELAELEQEFIRFLAMNSVSGPDWINMKKQEPKKAEHLINTFSELVFERILQKVEYLELRTPTDFKTFHCLPDKIVLLGLKIEGVTSLDFTEKTAPAQMLDQLKRAGAQLKMYIAEKAYTKERSIELFEMMERGCLISKGEMFRTLEALK